MGERTDTDRVDDLVSSGIELYSEGRMREAASKFEAALKIAPTDARAQKYLRDVRSDLGAGSGQEGEEQRAETSPTTGRWSPQTGDLLNIAGLDEEVKVDLSIEITDEPTIELPTFRRTSTQSGVGHVGFDVSDTGEPLPALDDMELSTSDTLSAAKIVKPGDQSASVFSVGDLEFEAGESDAATGDFDIGLGSIELQRAGGESDLDEPMEQTVERRPLVVRDDEVTVQRLGPIELDEEIVRLGEAELREPQERDAGNEIDDDLDFGLNLGFEKEQTEEFSRIAPPAAALFATELSTSESSRRDKEFAISVTRSLERDIRAALDANAPSGESNDEAIRRRVSALIDRALAEHARGRGQAAVVAASLAIEEAPESVAAQKLVHGSSEELLGLFARYIGNPDVVPSLAKPLHELTEGVDARDAFLLSRVDGLLTVSDIIDVSGMPSLESHRILCRLLIDGIIHAA